MRKRDGRDGSQAVGRAFDVLGCFMASGRGPLSVTEISGRVKLAVPTVYRLLKALRAREMVIADPVSRRYSLGPGVMRLAKVIMQRDDLHVIALPHLVALRERTGETVGLHCRVGHERVCVAELPSLLPIKMVSGIGHAYPLYAGAAGKALLAWLSKEDLDHFLAETTMRVLTAGTIGGKHALRAEIARVRKQGYATSFGETVVGASALAAPILGSTGEPVAVINVTGPEGRWTASRMAATVDALLDATAQVMSEFVGGDPRGERNEQRRGGRRGPIL